MLFLQTRRENITERNVFMEPHTPHACNMKIVLSNTVSHTRDAWQHTWDAYHLRIVVFFFIFLRAFSLQIWLGTWEKISLTFNTFRGLWNLHSMFSQFFMRCLAFPNYIVFLRYINNTYELLGLGKNYNYMTQYENITKYLLNHNKLI